MKRFIPKFLSVFLLILSACTESAVKTNLPGAAAMKKFDFSAYEAYRYTGDDLGCTWRSTNSSFKLWAPEAADVALQMFDSASGPENQVFPMTRNEEGIWSLSLPDDWNGKYYLYQISRAKGDGISVQTVPDPCSLGSAANSSRTLVYDPRSTDPEGWDKDRPVALSNQVDAVLYELHLRDISIHPSSGVPQKYRGKYSGLSWPGARSPEGEKTGLDHLTELGVTHVHILPCYDYGTGDETQSNTGYKWYNWGYDPVLYNTPEGSYATDPNGTVRQKEYKEMVQALHMNGIGVIFDAVYNHTFQSGNGKLSVFDKVFPGYYYRQEKGGKYGNATGCGNEVASERPMVRKFIVDSILYWMREYHVDGFRFDLMGVMDRETLLEAFREAKKINPAVLFYGEGWDMEKILPKDRMMIQANVRGTGIAAFNDGFRDNLKGDVFNTKARGFIQGALPAYGGIERLKLQIQGRSTGRNKESIPVDTPEESVNYVSCHDNLCIRDRITLSATNSTSAEQEAMVRLSAALVLTSQGIPFLCEGDEFLRSKNGNENSYNNNKPEVNPIDWSLKKAHRNVFDYVRGLIALRKAHPAFRMADPVAVSTHFSFREGKETNLIAYALTNHANTDAWKTVLAVFNGYPEVRKIRVKGSWNIVVDAQKAGTNILSRVQGEITVAPYGSVVAWSDDPLEWN